jgi:hypothetical protein
MPTTGAPVMVCIMNSNAEYRAANAVVTVFISERCLIDTVVWLLESMSLPMNLVYCTVKSVVFGNKVYLVWFASLRL